jgi:hypothetical protein
MVVLHPVFQKGVETGSADGRASQSFVALSLSSDLLLCAKHLFVAAKTERHLLLEFAQVDDSVNPVLLLLPLHCRPVRSACALSSLIW